ncbi:MULTISPECIES: hypothetical protein [unclassified Bradyrhizobium]|uniref:hypothetical protein n=1 Tax=unclassified Bradyrhizobium TaxID=2631580 RepID=UPI0028E20135|nr:MULTISPECIES: hypothetical protein [unclassified Bradyrhizobium]
MRKSSPKAGRAVIIGGAILLKVACGTAWAETADPPSAPPASPGETAKDSGPFGGCEPIGLTASGELVFPLECKKAIKKPADAPVASDEKAPSAEKSVTTDAKPAAADKSAATPENSTAEAKPATIETGTAAKEEVPKAAAAETTATATAKPVREAAAAAAKPAAAKPAVSSEKKAVAQAGGSKKAGGHAAATEHGAGEAKLVPALAKRLAMVKPAQPAAAKPPADAKAKLQTAAAVPACTHYRSYNPTTKSYLGFDGHTYACR